jgi:hypothetical protein
MNEAELLSACQSQQHRDQAQYQKAENPKPFPSLYGVKGFFL